MKKTCRKRARSLSRRAWLGRCGAAGLGMLMPSAGWLVGQGPAVIRREGVRPAAAQGVASGDVEHDRAIVWSRCDRPARMVVRWQTSERGEVKGEVIGPAVHEGTDFTGKVDLRGLPAGQRIVYEVQFQDLRDLKNWSEPVRGTLVTPASPQGPARPVKLGFTGDVCGQGWGIDPDRGGMRIFETMRQQELDLMVHLGDAIYADNPIEPEVRLEDGSLWRNVTTPEKSHVAQTLDDFRGCYRYNLLDEHLRRFQASTSLLVLWDDHETHNNWYPQGRFDDARYQERASALLAARARAAFMEYQPIRQHPRDRERIYRTLRCGPLVEIFAWDMRSYRGPNSANRQSVLDEESAILGRRQLAWLKRRLAASTATWKVIASDMPLGLVVRDRQGCEAVANGDDGPPLGRELEIADLLRFLRDRQIANVVFLTADVHYAAAHHYDPARARFGEFLPFWEFVAGPAHAGTFGPGQLDPTFGPEAKFVAVPRGMKPNRPPSEGLQFFGTLDVDAASKVLTARLWNVAGQELFRQELAAV